MILLGAATLLFFYGKIILKLVPTHYQINQEETKRTNAVTHGSSTWIVPPSVESSKTHTKEDLDETIPQRTPTHTACSSDSVQGIYHIAMGDIGGAAGTVFFQFVIAQILYAEQHGLKPWVHFSNVSHVIYDNAVHATKSSGVTLTAMTGRNATYYRRPGGHRRDSTPGPPDMRKPLKRETMHFAGTGVWEHYFEPVSDFVPGDRSCASKMYVTMDLYLITPGLHGYADYAPRCWRYKYMPDYIAKPHLGITEWLEPQRKTAFAVTQKYIHPRPYLKIAAAKVNPDCSLSNPCLGLHIRHSDKASGRRVIETAEFLPYAQAFLNAAARKGSSPHIYLATDSTLVIQEIERTWPIAIRDTIRSAGDSVLRSSNEVAVFDLDGASQHHRTNQEILIEILALSTCQFMVHGFSAVSEAAVWMGLHLHNQSVNLEDPDHLNVQQFETLVQMVVASNIPRNQWPRAIRSADVWPELFQPESASMLMPTNKACDGYDGVLLISSVGRTTSAGGGFFNSVLNQLVFADMHNLKPWVHLRSNHVSNALVYDEKIHSIADGKSVVFEMMYGMAISVVTLDDSDSTTIYPNVPALRDKDMSQHEFSVQGSGIWNSYFEPVSDFVPGDESCRRVPLIEIEEILVSPGLESYAPWSVKAWRYDKVSNKCWLDVANGESVNAWLEPMRVLGNQMIKKFYRFRLYITDRAERVNPVVPGQACLGLHLRNGDKTGNHRRKIAPDEFKAYVDVFERAGGRHVYIATDSHRSLQYIFKSYPKRLTKLMKSQGEYVVRSTKLDWPSHFLDDHHRVNSEVMVDILALSKCRILLHGFSTVSEAAIYLNPSLHRNSVNLEDPNRILPDKFETMVKLVIAEVNEKVGG